MDDGLWMMSAAWEFIIHNSELSEAPVSKFALTNKLVERLTINDEREISKAFMKICGQLLFPRNGYRPRPAT